MGLETVTMPKLGVSVTEGTLIKWLVQPGDRVKKYEPLAEVMTDKVTAEVPSSYAGIIRELLAAEGQTLSVGTPICTIENEESSSVGVGSGAGEGKEKGQSRSTKEKGIPSRIPNLLPKPRFSPAVLSLSRQYGIDLSQIKGTGKGGRITRKDVLLALERGNFSPIEQAGADTAGMDRKQGSTTEPVSVPATGGDVEIPVDPVRKAIAAHMVKSKTEIPHAWMMVEADVTELVRYRDKIKDSFMEREGFPLTYFAFFVKAVAQALREYPQLNSTWAGEKIIRRKEVNISIAVAADEELYVPVIRNADEKSIKGIARDIFQLARKARAKMLTPEDTRDGTFTVNNTGSFGSIQSMGIIHYPQAAILQVESIVKRPVIMESDFIGIRHMVNLCLSLDHRVLDGHICGRFLRRVKEILESMSAKTTAIY
jgi:branched-chain alpha-keto acid dehydrogenase E2 component (EC 2.3.1.168)